MAAGFAERGKELFHTALAESAKAWGSEERKWLLSFRSPAEIWAENPTFLLLEVVTYIWAILLYKHARRHGGRVYLLFWAAIFHGFVVECLSYVLPDIDNFWHGVSSVILFKQRLPLHIVLFYPCFHCTTNIAVSRLRLPWWSQPFAVGLADLLLDIPFDILGIKLLWWTWHDTDPNIFDRTYSVPLTSYIFHLTFASSFSLVLSTSRWLLTGSRDLWKAPKGGSLFAELVCVVLTAALSMPLAAALQFLPLYHVFHDLLQVHTEACVWVLLGLYLVLAWSGDRHAGMEARQAQGQGRKLKWFYWIDEISVSVLIHFVFYVVLMFLADPASYRSTGPHQTIGDCNKTSYINTVAGVALPKKPFLCLTNYSEPYFDFRCLKSLPPPDSAHYTVCGTPYDNQWEHALVVLSVCLLGLSVYYQILARSGRLLGKLKKA